MVVAYRSDAHLAGCLEALGTGCSVTVVDNDPNPATELLVREAGAVYVPAPRNLGFAGGVNLGLAHSWDHRSDVLLLNPDARIRPADLDRLSRALHDTPRLAAVGPLLRAPSGRAEPASWPMPSPLQVWLDALGVGRFWRGRRFVTGAVLLLRGQALAQIGGLDERYFLYAEEADWQLRALRQGWEVAVVESVTALHAGAASSSDPRVRNEIFAASGRAFAEKWYGRIGAKLMALATAVAAARRQVAHAARTREPT